MEQQEPLQTRPPESDESSTTRAPRALATNIVLVGAMGSGKTECGRALARALGFGWIDVDAWVEKRFKRPIAQVFRDMGEGAFRDEERRVIHLLSAVKSHVISVGGGALADDDNWRVLESLGAMVWLNPPAAAIASRLLAAPGELHARPLLADLVAGNLSADDLRTKITERIKALTGQRSERYGRAVVTFDNQFATPELTAASLKDLLLAEGLVRSPRVSPDPNERNL